MKFIRKQGAVCVCLALALLTHPLKAQSNAASDGQSPKTSASQGAAPDAEVHPADDPDLMHELQFGVRGKNVVGMVWWVPSEFWQISGEKRGIPAETTAQNMKALKDYTIVAVFLARVSGLGAFDFIPIEEIRKNSFLRDASGNEYRSIPEPSQDAKNLAAILKPILSAAMGKAGENFDLFFFPARGKGRDLIASATQKGRFSVVLKDNMVGVSESAYEFHTPLTAIAPAKFCPVGKERVHADWDYSPRHGVALNTPAGQ
jgi:hypothetical protein